MELDELAFAFRRHWDVLRDAVRFLRLGGGELKESGRPWRLPPFDKLRTERAAGDAATG